MAVSKYVSNDVGYFTNLGLSYEVFSKAFRNIKVLQSLKKKIIKKKSTLHRLAPLYVNKKKLTWGREGGSTNERRGTDPLILGPMRGLGKILHFWHRQTDRHTSGQ